MAWVKAVADAIGQALARMAEFLDVVDLSFFLPGILTLAACALLLGPDVAAILDMLNDPPGFILAVVLCYAAGVTSAAGGRLVRSHLLKGGYVKHMESAARLHGISEMAAFKTYFEKPSELSQPGARALHTRMWAELRQDASLEPSMKFLRRFWVLAAICDGTAFSALVAIAGLASHCECCTQGTWSIPWQGVVAAAGGLLVLCAVCVREAKVLNDAQISELCATLAVRASKDTGTQTGTI